MPTIDLPIPVEPNLLTEYMDLQQRIGDIMDLEHILNPEGENEQHQVDEEVSLEEIIERHIGTEIQDEDAILEDVEPQPMALPTTAQALEAVRLLQVYQEHEASTQHQDIRYLRQLERRLCTISVNSQSQSTLEGRLT